MIVEAKGGSSRLTKDVKGIHQGSTRYNIDRLKKARASGAKGADDILNTIEETRSMESFLAKEHGGIFRFEGTFGQPSITPTSGFGSVGDLPIVLGTYAMSSMAHGMMSEYQ